MTTYFSSLMIPIVKLLSLLTTSTAIYKATKQALSLILERSIYDLKFPLPSFCKYSKNILSLKLSPKGIEC
jgi:hypothetical protein